MRWRLSTKLVLHLLLQLRSGSTFFLMLCLFEISSFSLFYESFWFQQEEMKKLAKSERLAVHISNAANLVLFVAKVYASMESRSMAVIASTLDSLLDLLSGFILWFTANAMRKPNQFHYPIGKRRMQPVVCFCVCFVCSDSSLTSYFYELTCLTRNIYIILAKPGHKTCVSACERLMKIELIVYIL